MANILFTILLHLSWANESQTLFIPEGGTQTLPLKKTAHVWIEDKAVLKAQVKGHELHLKGILAGRSAVRMRDQTWLVEVIDSNHWLDQPALTSALEQQTVLSHRVSDGKSRVFGQIDSLKDWLQLAQHKLNYALCAEFSRETQNEAKKYFEDLFLREKLPLPVLIFGQCVEMRLPKRKLQTAKAKALIKGFGIQVFEDDLAIAVEPVIKVQITIAEVKREVSQKYGIKWPGSYGARLVNGNEWEMDELLFSAQALESKGHGKILASPNILCRSGSEAEFMAGGEFPIKVLNYKTQDVVWKKYGIILKIKPQADSSGRMSLSISTEVSSIDAAKAVDGIPGLFTNRVSSHFDLTEPRTIALSGLIKSEEGQSSDGLPLLSRLPILGALFSSKDFRENRTELVIFVKPSILNETANDPPTRNL